MFTVVPLKLQRQLDYFYIFRFQSTANMNKVKLLYFEMFYTH